MRRAAWQSGRSGIGTVLIAAVETWARERGYAELASDADVAEAI